jgi:hypothetical protein
MIVERLDKIFKNTKTIVPVAVVEYSADKPSKLVNSTF